MQESDAKGWIVNIMRMPAHDNLTWVLAIFWALWHAWRKLSYENTFYSLLSTHISVPSFISELQALRNVKVKKEDGTTTAPRWIPRHLTD